MGLGEPELDDRPGRHAAYVVPAGENASIKGLIMRALIAAFLIIATTPGWAVDASITDGATLIVDGVAYRLDGIDAPQTDQTCLNDKGAAWACGIEARDRLREHIGKRDVRCTDKGADSTYRKRRIGECSIVGEPISINQWMVQEGWALNSRSLRKGPVQSRQRQCERQTYWTLEGLLRIA